MSKQLIRFEKKDGVARITLAHSKRHNTLTPPLLSQLLEALNTCQNAQTQVVILDAEGISFSLGGDVSEFFKVPQNKRATYAAEIVGLLNQVIISLLKLPVPIIASVQGMVTGGSLGLVLASDIVIASTQASFTPWYTVVGFSPDGGWSKLMGEKIGPSRALEIQLTNRSLQADKALDYGLVHYLTEASKLTSKTEEICQLILNKKKNSLQRTLKLSRPDPKAVAADLQIEYEQFLEQIVTDEAHYGMAEFLKQTP